MKKVLSILLVVIMLFCSINVMISAENEPNSTKRYTVLVLDTSSTSTFTSNGEDIYTADTAIEYVQRASSRFLDNISEASGENYVAVVSYKDSATSVSNFTKDFESLKNKINSLYASSNTRSISAGLAYANTLLQGITDENTIKNVVLFTTGMTNAGEYSYSGQYDENTVGSNWYRTDTNVNLYAYANSACAQAELLKEKDIGVYIIGLFQTMEQMPAEGQDVVSLFKLTANDLATSDDYYYPVDDPSNLEFTFGEVADDIVNQLKEITFTYQSGKDYTAKCYYTNDYFSESAYNYNPSLATMSLSFAMSAFGSSKGGQSDYANKSDNAEQLLMDIGMHKENIKTNDWFTQKPTTDSIGVIVGNMPITVNDEDYTLIALAVRGGGYESEWASNFTIGNSGQHKGFNTAKNNVLNYLRNFVEEQNITGAVKFWITGYSRAAATANLVGGAIDNGALISTDISYNYDDIYTYCFETPAGALTSDVKGQVKYNNIFNIINSNDPVPYVAPAVMGFCRYGIDRYLPSQESLSNYATLKANMLNIYNGLDSTEDYIVDDFQMKKITGVNNWLPGGKKISLKVEDDTENNYSQALFLSKYVTILAKEFIRNRDNYVSVYQDEIREICSVMFGCTDEQSRKLMDSIVSQAKNEWKDLAWSYVWNVGFNPFGSEDDALQVVSNWLKTAVKDAGITNYNEAKINSAGKALADLLLALVSNHPNYFTTAIMNGSSLGAAHYPELCYSWLASMDNNYTKGAHVELSNGGYRIIHINCAVDVDVYDKNNNKVASIKNEQPNTNLDTSIIYGIDEDGQKFVVLPLDGDYYINITGREDDEVDYSISEYSALMGDFIRNINYYDVELKKGETLTGKIPSYSQDDLINDTPNGSDLNYILLDSNNDLIESDFDKYGDDVVEDYHKVNATSSNIDQGIVLGSGLHLHGTFAKLDAVAAEGYRFSGWYKDNELLSIDPIYRLRVTEDVEIIGKFEQDGCLHSETEIIPGTPATCTEKGLSEGKKCSICGEIILKQVETPTIGHNYTEVITEPTCTEGGYTTRTCNDCGHIIKEDEIPATGHTSSDWIVENAATDNDEGLEVKKCTVCDEILEERSIPKLIKDYKLGDINGDGKVTAADARIILRIATRLDSINNYKNGAIVADVDKNGKITPTDARKVLRASARLETLDDSSNPVTPDDPPVTEKPLSAVEIHDIAITYTVEINAEGHGFSSIGSGFSISADGKIVTNYHVIEDAYCITVTDYEGYKYNVTKILAYDSYMDIAVLQIDGFIAPATLNYDTPKTGAVVYTLGSSKGLTDTFTNGIVSNNSRVVDDYNPDMTYIQITAPITNGNSGGPTINEYAEVIGINTWGLTDGQNMNFAIPVKYIDELDYSDPIDMTKPPKNNDDEPSNVYLEADLDDLYLCYGGTAVIYVESYGFDSSDLVISYNGDYVYCEWSDEYFYNSATGHDISVLFVTGLSYVNSLDIKIYVDGYESVYYEYVSVSVSSEGWNVYGGYPGAVDFGAYSGVAPIAYYIPDDAEYCGFMYSINDLFNAGLTPDNMVDDFFNYLYYYGFEEVDYVQQGNDYTWVFYNDYYDLLYSIAYYLDDGYISILFGI